MVNREDDKEHNHTSNATKGMGDVKTDSVDMSAQTVQMRKRKKIITIVSIIVGVIVFILVISLVSGSSGSAIEVISQPKMTFGLDGCVYVKAEVKNKSNKNITVWMECTIYDDKGSVSMNISSLSIKLAPGESYVLVANKYVSSSLYIITSKCHSFGNVEYKCY